MYWVNFLHLYQPPDQYEDLLRVLVETCYSQIFRILKNNPHQKMTLNIAGSLTEQFAKRGYSFLIEEIKELLQKGQLEMTDSAKYHAFLPLLPESEVKRQILLNRITNKRYFGKFYQPRGIHLPEMAYSKKLGKIIAEMGYEWVILNETSFKGKLFEKIDTSKIFVLKGYPNLKIFFRNRKISDVIQRGFVSKPDDFYQAIQNEGIGENEYLITAVDGETFGHHRPGLEKVLEKIYQEGKVKTYHIADLLKTIPINGEIDPIPGSWASLESEIKKKIYYTQWKYPKNPIHQRQWRLTYLAIQTVNENKKDPNYKKARKILDKALFSCQYWWAGAVPWWEIEYIEKGAFYLKKSIETLKKVKKEIKKKAQELYDQIVKIAFDWERSGFAHKKSIKYTQKVIQELREKIPVSPLHSKR